MFEYVCFPYCNSLFRMPSQDKEDVRLSSTTSSKPMSVEEEHPRDFMEKRNSRGGRA